MSVRGDSGNDNDSSSSSNSSNNENKSTNIQRRKMQVLKQESAILPILDKPAQSSQPIELN